MGLDRSSSWTSGTSHAVGGPRDPGEVTSTRTALKREQPKHPVYDSESMLGEVRARTHVPYDIRESPLRLLVQT